LEREDVGMLEPGDQPRFVAKLLDRAGPHQVRVRHLERDTDPLDGVAGLVDHREPTLSNPPLDNVLTEPLTGTKHGNARPGPGRRKSVGRQGRSAEAVANY